MPIVILNFRLVGWFGHDLSTRFNMDNSKYIQVYLMQFCFHVILTFNYLCIPCNRHAPWRMHFENVNVVSKIRNDISVCKAKCL